MSNVRPGDLAYLVAPWLEEGRGRIVRVVRAATPDDWRMSERLVGCHLPTSVAPCCWYCEGDIVLWCGPVRQFCIHDDALRPIRPHDDDATDESAAWLPPVPRETPAEVPA